MGGWGCSRGGFRDDGGEGDADYLSLVLHSISTQEIEDVTQESWYVLVDHNREWLCSVPLGNGGVQDLHHGS